MSLRFSWQMLQLNLWNGLKVWIREMKSEMKRQKKKNFGPNIHQTKSRVILNSRNEEMKKKLFQTYFKQNLVLFQFQEMKSEMKRWKNNFCLNIHQVKSGVISNLRDEENSVRTKHMLSQIWCNLKFERWRVRWTDKFFQSKHMSSQIWCYLRFERWRVR